MAEKMKKRIVVGATGASGLPLLIKCLEIIREKPDYESYLIMSSSAELTLCQETIFTVEDVKKLADGRTYTAKQAKNNGLIDETSLYPDMKDAMSKKLGTSTFYEMESDEGLLQSLFSKAESLVPKSEAQVLTETAEEMESGVPMYYAEQLR